MSDQLLSVVIPVYNGDATIIATLDAIVGYLSPRRPFEILVVDDGSRDRTASLVSAYAVQHRAITLIRFARNCGKGAAVRCGALAATGSLIAFCDADLPILVAEIETLVSVLGRGCDVAIASRALPQSAIPTQPSLIRRLTSRAFGCLVRALFKLSFRDTQCGFKGFRRDAARAVFSRARIDGFAFDVELLVLAGRLGCRIDEFPVRWENPLLSTVSVRTHAWPICADLWRIARNLRRDVYGLAPVSGRTVAWHAGADQDTRASMLVEQGVASGSRDG